MTSALASAVSRASRGVGGAAAGVMGRITGASGVV